MIDLFKNRRSVRKFLDKPVEKELIDKLIYAALLGPSSKDSRPWEFIVVEDSSSLSMLSECKPIGASFLKDAPLAIVILADPEKSEVWIEDCAISAAYMQLVAEQENLGSCWVQVRGRMFNNKTSSSQYIKELLKIPDNYEVASVIGFGHKENIRPPHHEGHVKFDQVHQGMFKEDK